MPICALVVALQLLLCVSSCCNTMNFACLQWINYKLKDISVQSFEDLEDGVYLCQLLQDMVNANVHFVNFIL